MTDLNNIIFDKLGIEQGNMLIDIISSITNGENINKFIIFEGKGNEGKTYLLHKIEELIKHTITSIRLPYNQLLNNNIKLFLNNKITILSQENNKLPHPHTIKEYVSKINGPIFIETNHFNQWKTLLTEYPALSHRIIIFSF